jgi:antitoxin VapB
MSLYIRNEETDRLVRELAQRTGESITDAVTSAVREKLERLPAVTNGDDFEAFWAKVQDLQRKVAEVPLRDPRPHGEVLYGEDGLPV